MDVVYVIGPALLIAIVLASVWLDRWSIPVILVALAAGILFGSDVLNLWHFDDITLTNQVANLALVLGALEHGVAVDAHAEDDHEGGAAKLGEHVVKKVKAKHAGNSFSFFSDVWIST